MGDAENPEPLVQHPPWRQVSRRVARHVQNKPASACCRMCAVAVALVSFILFCCSWDSLAPTQYGLLYNDLTGHIVDATAPAFEGGLHFVWLKHKFLTFPASQTNIEYSSSPSADGPPVLTRTGPADPHDPESGGQPLNISFAFQWKFEKDTLATVYNDFGMQYLQRYDLISRNVISNTAQSFTPQDFWTKRPLVVEQMRTNLTSIMHMQGHVKVMSFQLLRVDFDTKYEEMITLGQLKQQQAVTKGYERQVNDTYKQIEVLTAKNNAIIARVNATAEARSSVLLNDANTRSFSLVQTAKALSYKALQAKLGLDQGEMLHFLKLKTISQHNGGNVVVGIDGAGSQY